MIKRGYAIVRDQFGNPKFDDGSGRTAAEIWNAMPSIDKEGYRAVMTDAEKEKFTIGGYNADT